MSGPFAGGAGMSPQIKKACQVSRIRWIWRASFRTPPRPGATVSTPVSSAPTAGWRRPAVSPFAGGPFSRGPFSRSRNPFSGGWTASGSGSRPGRQSSKGGSGWLRLPKKRPLRPSCPFPALSGNGAGSPFSGSLSAPPPGWTPRRGSRESGRGGRRPTPSCGRGADGAFPPSKSLFSPPSAIPFPGRMRHRRP